MPRHETSREPKRRRGGPHRADALPVAAAPGLAKEYRYLICPACGTPACEDRFRRAVAPGYAQAAKIKRIGGYKSIAWRQGKLFVEDRRLLLAALHAAMTRI